MVRRTVLQRIGLYRRRIPDCAWVRQRLGAYGHRDLPNSELDAVEKHVQRCPECWADWEEVRTVCDWLADEFLRQRGVTSSSEERVSGIMARIEAYEAEKARKARQKKTTAGSRGFRLRPVWATACLAVFLIALAGIGYAVLCGKWRGTEAPAPAGLSEPVTQHIALVSPMKESPPPPIMAKRPVKPSDVTAQPPMDDLADLEQELVDGILLDLKVRSLLPQTDEEYEQWARKEYPHVMWLYDVLKEQYAYQGDWRDLLVRSGEIYRFDWPTTLKEPNCRPRIEGLRYAALVAGYEIEFTEKGEYILPVLDWVDEDKEKLDVVFLSLRRTEPLEAAPILVAEVREGYVRDLYGHPATVQSTLVYLTVSSDLSGKPQLMSLTERLRAVLSTFLESATPGQFMRCPVPGHRNSPLLEEIKLIIDLRHEILLAETSKGLDITEEM